MSQEIKDRLIANVKAMREKQNEYFRTRNQTVLREAKSLESMVDRDIKLLDAEDDGQQVLFGDDS